MQKRNLLIFLLVAALAVLVVYPRLGGAGKTANVSQVAANPSNYLGKLTLVNVRVSSVDAESSVITLADSGGCCEIPAMVPVTEEHQQAMGVPVPLYTGTLPVAGQFVEVSGTLKQHQGFYIYEVDTVKRDGQVILKKK